MSSLVAYASSDDSDDGEEENIRAEAEPRDLSLNQQQLKKNPEKENPKISQTEVVSGIEAKQNSTSNEKKNPVNPLFTDSENSDKKTEENSIFRALPVPSQYSASSAELPETELEDLVKPKKSQMATLPKPLPLPNKRIQISIPTLDSDSDEDEVVTKKKPKFSGSGNLLDILPPPKHMSIKQANRSLIPHTLSKKPSPANRVTPNKTKNISAKKSFGTTKVLTDYNNSDEDEEDITKTSNFFSLDSDKKTPILSYPSLPINTLTSKTQISSGPLEFPSRVAPLPSFGQDRHLDKSPQNFDIPIYPQDQPQTVVQPSYEPTLPEFQPPSLEKDLTNMDDLLRDEQFLRLQGKNQRGKEQIQIMDVNTDDFIDPSELTKTLTQEMPKHSHKKNKDAPSKQSRNKHQITYLAYQAKERELELKNQWSQNRLTKRQTQAKYGF